MSSDKPARSRPGALRTLIGVMTRPLRSVVAMTVVLLLVVGGGFALLSSGLVPGLGQVFGQGHKTVSSVTLSAGFADLSELVVEEYNYKDIGKFTEADKKVFNTLSVPLTSKSFMITYSGTVKAGVRDFTALQVSIDDANKVIEVTAPQVEVLDSSIDPASVQVFDESHNPLNQITVSDVTEFQAQREQASVDEAVAAGLLDKATKRTESILSAHLASVLKETDKADYEVRISWVVPLDSQATPGS